MFLIHVDINYQIKNIYDMKRKYIYLKGLTFLMHIKLVTRVLNMLKIIYLSIYTNIKVNICQMSFFQA